MITEAVVRQALDTIVDPCSRAAGCEAGLQTMGLVRQVALVPREDGRVDVRVVLAVTEYGCLMGAPFSMEACKRLEVLEGIGAVDVALDERFDWDPSDMEPAYVQRLAEHRRRAGVPVRVHRRVAT